MTTAVVKAPARTRRRAGRRAVALGAAAASLAGAAVAAAPAEAPVVGADAADAACATAYTYATSTYPTTWSTYGFKTTGANCNYNASSTYTALYDCWRGWYWDASFSYVSPSLNTFCFPAASGLHVILSSVFSGNIVYFQGSYDSYVEAKF